MSPPTATPALALAVVCWSLAGASLLIVVPTPWHRLWKPAVAATEWGHWLAVASAAAAATQTVLAGLGGSAAAAAVAAALFVSPIVRASRLAGVLPRSVGRAFPPASGEQERYGGGRRLVPFSVPRLLRAPVGRVARDTLVYCRRGTLDLTLDLYRADPRRPGRQRRVVILVHGGSWNSGDSSQLAGVDRYLASRGHVVAALNYRLAPEHRFPAPVDDIHAAMDFLASRAEGFGFDPDAMVLAGRSSGGHLALSAAYDRRRPRRVGGVVALYAPTDLLWSWDHPAPPRMMDSNRAIRDFLGGSPHEVPGAFEAASPVLQAAPDLPPTLLIHGGQDELVSPIQSRRLSDALAGAGARRLHVELPWGHHGMEANVSGPSGQISLYLIERFLAWVWGPPSGDP